MSDLENNDQSSVADNDTEVTEVTPDYESLSSQFSENDDSQESNSEENSGGINPAWNDILSVIPEPLHAQVTPHLSKWDKSFQDVQQKFAPYKQFAEQGVTPDLISNSLTLAQAIQADPQAVYNQMREQFGLSHEEAVEAIEDAEEGQGDEEYGDEEDGEDYGAAIENHPLVQQLQAEQQRLIEMQETRQREEMLDNIRREVEAEWSEIEQMAGGKLPDHIRADIQQRALNLAGDDGMPRLMDGFKQHIQFASQIRNSSANNSAPSVASGNGLLPTAKVHDMATSEGRRNFIADFVKSNMNNGG